MRRASAVVIQKLLSTAPVHRSGETRPSGTAIDAYFLAGGMIFTRLAICHRRYRQILALG
jgi:hypothetical protein